MSLTKKLIPVLILIAGCSSPGQDADSSPIAEGGSQLVLPKTNWTEGETSTDNAPTEGQFTVEFKTTAGKFTMLVHRDWAPRAAERFYQLINSHYYDGAPFFRVVPGFMVQFGICGDPAGTKYWDVSFPDEPPAQSNQVGMVSYAKTGLPNSRSTQIFINYGDNANLDEVQRDGSCPFAPFAEIIDGMNKVNAITSRYGQQPSQPLIERDGNEYIFDKFPAIDYVISAKFVDGEVTSGDAASLEESASDSK